MSLTTADVYSFRQTNQKLHDAEFLRLDATAINATTNLGGGVYETNLLDYTLDPGVYTIDIVATGGASACSILVSVDGSCTASMFVYALTTVTSGFNLSVGSTVASGDTCIIEILNDYSKAYNLSVLELTRFVATSESDYAYWLTERTNRHLLAKALREMALTAYDIQDKTGESMNLSQRSDQIRYMIREMDKKFSDRTASAYLPPEDADIVWDMANAFDETQTGYADVDEY